MRIFRLSDVNISNSIDHIIAWDGVYRDGLMPDEIAEQVATWKLIKPSPGSGSVYDTNDKTWFNTPLGSLRAANHWNWFDRKYTNSTACPINVYLPDHAYWAIGQWTGMHYEILCKAKRTDSKTQNLIHDGKCRLSSIPEFRPLRKQTYAYISNAIKAQKAFLANKRCKHEVNSTPAHT